jgi:hypothetical protein
MRNVKIMLMSILLIVSVSCATTRQERAASDSVNSNEELLQAAVSGNIDEVRRMIEAGADVNARAEQGVTALMLAAYGGYTRVARLLIEAGADLDLLANNGCTALMWAALSGRSEVARVLIDAGANVDVSQNDGVTALMLAALEGHSEVIRLLIEAGADPNATNKQGKTALMIAEAEGHSQVSELLWDCITVASQSKFLPFTIDDEHADKIATLFLVDELPAKPYRLMLEAGVSVPDRVTYIPLSPAENRKHAEKFLKVCSDGSDHLAGVQDDNVVVLGPHLTTLLKQGGVLSKLEYGKLVYSGVIGKPFVLIGAGIRGNSIPAALKLIRNILYCGDAVNVRTLNNRELDWYWTIISWDIEEPVFVFENRKHTLLIDFERSGEVFYVDILDGLAWGP